MSYEKHRQVINDYRGDNVLCDGDISVSYAAIPEILDELDVSFTQQHRSEICCVGVIMENTVAHALLVLYFLSEGINFFLLSVDSPVHNDIPAFCDRILTLVKDGDTGPLAGRHMRMRPNPAYHGKPMDIRPGSACACFSSSGTSGRAKYICFRHLPLLRNAGNCLERFGINSASKILIPVPAGHMFGLGVGLLPALLAGASICLIEKNNIVKLLGKTAEFRPSVTLLTPAVIRMLLLLNKQSTSEGFYITAGEKISRQAYQDFEKAYGPLFNLYGCTEMGAIAVSSGSQNDGEARIEGFIKPLPHVEVRTGEAPAGQLLCRHNAGFETYINSEGMILVTPALADGWYATSDTGILEQERGFRVIGRMDHCVNRSGFLVSLDEIGMILEDKFMEIRQAVVFESEDENSLTTKLTAVCELAGGCLMEGNTARSVCKSIMNRYQVPDEFYFIRDMPRLGSGKPDRKFIIANYKTL
jgi:acyl-coenzyme A synthetase/AMP-(fatty) acid ligase